MKGYSLNISNQDKLLNEYNNQYGLSLKKEKKNPLLEYLKPKNKK